jgi:CheY-like chemotaxis protein
MEHPILLVDDSALVRTATTRRLAERGLQVTALGSSREASIIDPTRFAAALLDIDLGDGFGPDVAAYLRVAAPGLPIAFLTAREEGGTPTAGDGADVVLDAARAFGPIFCKVAGVDEAIGWLLAVVSPVL